MKKLLLILILFLTSFGESLIYAQMNVEDDIMQKKVSMKRREDSGIDKKGGVSRCPTIQLANVFILNQQLLIEFIFPVTNVTITVTNADTGKIVYSEFYSVSEIESIDLTSEDSDKYEIELIAEDWALYGEFEIGNNH